MAGMNIFTSDAFSAITMASAYNRRGFVPTMLGDMNLFQPRPVRTTDIWIERRDGVLAIVPTTPRTAPPVERPRDTRNMFALKIPRLAEGDTLTAEQLQNIRAFGSETEFMQVQQEVARITESLKEHHVLTHENMQLSVIQGLLTDADGSVLYNYFTETGESQAAEIDFDLDNASPAAGVLRQQCVALARAMRRASRGAWGPGVRIVALVGDTFFDQLIKHSEVRSTYLASAAAADLRGSYLDDRFLFGGIEWINYRGTDDNSTIAVPATKAFFFPVGAPGVFEVAYAPAEFLPFVNTLGQPFYPMTLQDPSGREAFVRVELYSYHLYYCTRPGMLQRGKNT